MLMTKSIRLTRVGTTLGSGAATVKKRPGFRLTVAEILSKRSHTAQRTLFDSPKALSKDWTVC